MPDTLIIWLSHTTNIIFDLQEKYYREWALIKDPMPDCAKIEKLSLFFLKLFKKLKLIDIYIF